MPLVVVIRGGGDLATGVALRLFRAGFRLIVTELPQPLAVRRSVSFAEAVYQGQITVESVTARLVSSLDEAMTILAQGQVPVLVDPMLELLPDLAGRPDGRSPIVLVDARMTKTPPEAGYPLAGFVVGLGPGHVAGQDCQAVVETQRGHYLGRVIWQGASERDTGIPDSVAGRNEERVLRAPGDGELQAHAEIGDHLQRGQQVAVVAGFPVYAPFSGVLRGLIHPGVWVRKGSKIGDVDPRDEPRYCWLVSDKSMAIGGGVLEAILSRPELRPYIWV
jgi:xanthine dehydrogenase accessory factor